MESSRVHLIITGRVQGVFFRASTRDIADSLDLNGYVRNLRDGSVEAVFEGSREQIEKAVDWCRKGPPGAAVTQVDEKWLDSPAEFDSFSIRYDF